MGSSRLRHRSESVIVASGSGALGNTGHERLQARAVTGVMQCVKRPMSSISAAQGTTNPHQVGPEQRWSRTGIRPARTRHCTGNRTGLLFSERASAPRWAACRGLDSFELGSWD